MTHRVGYCLVGSIPTRLPTTAHERYACFMVHGGKIIREQLSFSDRSESGFDPRILVSEEDSEPIWFSEKGGTMRGFGTGIANSTDRQRRGK
jgi:hypothetical protein